MIFGGSVRLLHDSGPLYIVHASSTWKENSPGRKIHLENPRLAEHNFRRRSSKFQEIVNLEFEAAKEGSRPFDFNFNKVSRDCSAQQNEQQNIFSEKCCDWILGFLDDESRVLLRRIGKFPCVGSCSTSTSTVFQVSLRR